MAVTPDRPGPYAPGSVVTELLERHRSKGLPTPVTADVLARAGVSDSLIPRTLQALQALELIDEAGAPTKMLEGLRLAPEGDYKGRVAEWLRAVYADALQYVDPATDGETAIRDAFRQYNPVGQQPRMVTLFSVLFRYAGIGPEKPPLTPQARRNKATITGKPRQSGKVLLRPLGAGAGHHGADGGGGARGGSGGGAVPQGLPPAIAGVLASLPDPALGWVKADRDRFLVAFTAVLDFAIPTVAAVQRRQELAEGDDEPDA